MIGSQRLMFSLIGELQGMLIKYKGRKNELELSEDELESLKSILMSCSNDVLCILEFFERTYRKRLEKNDRPELYVAVPRSLFRLMLGGVYNKALKWLKKKGLIEVQTRRGTSREAYEWRDNKNKFCKSYRLSKVLRYALKNNLIKIPKYTFSAKKLKRLVDLAEDKTDYSNPVCAKTAENMKKLDEIDTSGLSFGAALNAAKINARKFSNSQSDKTGRLYSNINLSHSGAFLDRLRVDGEELVEIDYDGCHNHYLPSLLENGLCKGLFIRQLERHDIYETFVEDGVTRKQVKGSFQKFLAGKTWGDRVAQKIGAYFQVWFKSIYELTRSIKLRGGLKMQALLQKIEASIMMKAFMSADFFCLTRHDSMLVKKSDAEKAVALLKQHAREFLGYDVPVSVEG
jgi:hypothetical protein